MHGRRAIEWTGEHRVRSRLGYDLKRVLRANRNFDAEVSVGVDLGRRDLLVRGENSNAYNIGGVLGQRNTSVNALACVFVLGAVTASHAAGERACKEQAQECFGESRGKSKHEKSSQSG